MEIVKGISTSNVYVFVTVLGFSLFAGSWIYADKKQDYARQFLIDFSEYSSSVIREANDDEIEFHNMSDAEKQKVINKQEFQDRKFSLLGAKMLAAAKEFDAARKIRNYGGGTSFLIGLIGLCFWYRNIQVPQDKILAEKSKGARVVFKKPNK